MLCRSGTGVSILISSETIHTNGVRGGGVKGGRRRCICKGSSGHGFVYNDDYEVVHDHDDVLLVTFKTGLLATPLHAICHWTNAPSSALSSVPRRILIEEVGAERTIERRQSANVRDTSTTMR